MSTISLRLTDDETKLVKEYIKINNLSLSSFVRDLIIDKIEEDLKLDEKRILNARNKINKEKTYTHEEFWERFDM